MKNNKKIVILSGVTGQDGSFLAELLLDKGYEVHGIIRRSSTFNTNRIEHIFNKLNLHYGDLTDSLSIDTIMYKIKPDEIYNLGAQSHVKVSFEIPGYTAQVDAIGTLNMLEAMRKHCPYAKFYNATTSELFGEVLEIPQTEKTPFNPQSPYGCFPKNTKILVKKYQKRYNKMSEIATSTKIETINIGDYVLSFDEITHEKKYDKVIDIMSRDTNETYLIKFSNGNELECTEEHPIYTIDNKWINAKDLKIGDRCIQYIYNALHHRLNNFNKRGKTYEEFYGTEKANKIKMKKKLNPIKNCPEASKYIYIDGIKTSKKNNLEIKFEKILNEILPGEFIYNGCLEQNLMINKKIPDFVNNNGKKKIIELFGTYWHTKVNKMSEQDLILHYKNEGYDCLVIWDTELKNYNTLKQKIETFFYNPKVEIITITDIIKKQKKQKVYNLTTEKYNNYFAYGILVHNCAKLFSYFIAKNYRESYNMFVANGILFNHESERRGSTFVTKKITEGLVNYIKTNKSFYLGNLEAKRDWGYAKDFVKGMFMMLQQDKPNDYVLATGETHSIKEFIIECLKYFPNHFLWKKDKENRDILWDYNLNKLVIGIDPQYYRPSEVNLLLGDASKAKKDFGWEPTVKFKELVEIMMTYELNR